MSGEGWVIATDARRLGAMVSAVRRIGGRVTVVAVGPRSLAETAAIAGPDAVMWIEAAENVPAEAYVSTLRSAISAISAAEPQVVLAATTPPSRALLGAAAAALNAVVISGILRMSLEGDTLVAERTDLGGRVLETVASGEAVAGLFGGDDVPTPVAAQPAPIEPLNAERPIDLRIENTHPVSGANAGVTSAERVVAVGRGLKTKTDLTLLEDLAATLGAECGTCLAVAAPGALRWEYPRGGFGVVYREG